MKRKVHITRKDATPKYSGKVLNIWLDSDAPNPPNYKLAAGKTITAISVNEKEHYLVLQRPGFLGGAVQRYTIPKGCDDLELTVTVNGYGQIFVRKKPGKKNASASNASSGSKASGGTKAGGTAKKSAPTARNLYVTRGGAEGYVQGTPIRMAVDYMSKQPVIYEFDPNMEYTIATDKKKHDLVFFYPDVQTGDLVLKTLDAGSKDVAFLVDFDKNGVLTVSENQPPKKPADEGNGIGSTDKTGIKSGGSEVKSGGKTTTPDLAESLTAAALTADVMGYFGEKSEFAADLNKVAKTCFLTAEEDRLKVTIMVEDFETAQALPDAGTQVIEFKYAEADTAPYFEHNFMLTQKALENQFDVLTREEDRLLLVEKVLLNLSNMPHLIVEGNTFRSRRKGEELIDVAHTLTAAAMKHKIMKLFTPDSKLVNVLRHSNVDYCQVSAEENEISFVYLDKDTEICEIIDYTFEELVGPELLEGEDCFGQLRYGHEKDMLSGVIGQGLCTLPYLMPYREPDFESVLGLLYYSEICLNPEVISKISEAYETPAWILGTQQYPENPEGPETSDEPELLAKSTLADSPTTQGMIVQLAEYFKDGGAFDLLMKSMQIARAVLNAGSEEVSVGFMKELPDGSLNVTGNFELQYKNFGAGSEGAFTELTMDQQDELEEILWNEFPFLRN